MKRFGYFLTFAALTAAGLFTAHMIINGVGSVTAAAQKGS